MKKTKNIFIAIFFGVFLVACGNAAVSDNMSAVGTYQNEQENEINRPFIGTYLSEFASIAPLGDNSASTREILRNMHDALYGYYPDGSLFLSLAEEIIYEMDDTFVIAHITLRENIYFHTGRTIDAWDVEYSFKRLAGLIPEIDTTQILAAGLFTNMLNGNPLDGFTPGRIEVHNEHQLTAYFDNNTGISAIRHQLADGVIVPRDYPEYLQQVHPVGAGPFKFVEHVPGDRIVFTRFDQWHRDLPEIIDAEFRLFTDPTVMTLAFQAGEIDILTVNDENYTAIAAMGVEIYEGLSNDVWVLYLNHLNDYFSDIRVRQAIHYAIDQELINQIAAGGRGAALHSHMSPFLTTYYNPNLRDMYPFNPERALELLAEAGFPNGFNANFRIVDNPQYHDIAAVVQAQLANVGINLGIESMPWGTFFPEVFQGRNFEVNLLNIVGFADASRILGRYLSTANGNISGHSHPELDRLILGARASADHAVAIEKYKEVQRVLAEEAVAFWTIAPGIMTALSPDFVGFRNYPFAFVDISIIRFAR
ncbi:MAG: ABC transporter substrate-binding protein [Defluviitaleaceae bacterium]|nr:ABC transporter substrate-binding protein [Defluviitaleaceae bacterium]